MIFFGIIADTAADLRKKEKRKKKRKERNNFENCGDDDCAEEWIFSTFLSYRSNFENGDDETEEK